MARKLPLIVIVLVCLTALMLATEESQRPARKNELAPPPEVPRQVAPDSDPEQARMPLQRFSIIPVELHSAPWEQT